MAKGNFKKIEARIKENFYHEIQFRIKSINSNTSKHYKEPIRLNEQVEYFKSEVEKISLENMDLKKEVMILKKLNALPLWKKIFNRLYQIF